MSAPSPRQSPEDPRLVFTDLAGLPKREGPVRRARRPQRWPLVLAFVVILAVAAFCLALAGPARAAEPVQAQPTQRAKGLLAWTGEDKAGATSPVFATHKRAPVTVDIRIGPCEKGDSFAVTLVRQSGVWPHPAAWHDTVNVGCSRGFHRLAWGSLPAGRYLVVSQLGRAEIVRTRTWSGLAFYDGRRPS